MFFSLSLDRSLRLDLCVTILGHGYRLADYQSGCRRECDVASIEPAMRPGVVPTVFLGSPLPDALVRAGTRAGRRLRDDLVTRDFGARGPRSNVSPEQRATSVGWSMCAWRLLVAAPVAKATCAGKTYARSGGICTSSGHAPLVTKLAVRGAAESRFRDL